MCQLYHVYIHLPSTILNVSVDLSFQGDEPSFTCHGDESIDADSWPVTKSQVENEGRRGDVSSESTQVTDKEIFRTSSQVKRNKIKDSTCTNYSNFEGKYRGTEIFIGTLDYFWYSSDTLYCNGILKMVDECDVSRFHSAPNEVFPSDHMIMKAQFQFVSK